MENSMSTGSAAREAGGRAEESGLRLAGSLGGIFGKLALVAVVVAMLPGCSTLRSALGMSKHPPDEFAVMTKAPLVMPPDFALRPPKPGAEQPQVTSPGAEARQTIFGLDTTQSKPMAGQSEGEFALLQKSGADNADPEIRGKLETDNIEPPKKRGFVSRVLCPFCGGSKAKKQDTAAADTGQEKIAPHPAGQVQQGAIGSPDAQTAASPDAPTASDEKPKDKKKKGWLRRLIPF